MLVVNMIRRLSSVCVLSRYKLVKSYAECYIKCELYLVPLLIQGKIEFRFLFYRGGLQKLDLKNLIFYVSKSIYC